MEKEGFGPNRRLSPVGGNPRTDGGSNDSIEEAPAMRSVGMTMIAPSLVHDPFGSAFGGGKVGFAKPLGLARPSLGLPKKSIDSSVQLEVKQEWTGAAAPSLWDVKSTDLELVPLDFPLERTHREIQGTDSSTVSNRISDALRSLSIDAQYDNKKAKAKCTTSDLVSFRIRLFAGSETGDPVVVEVQRRSGSASSFMISCRAILNAAEGMNVKKLPSERNLPMSKIPVSQMACLKPCYDGGFDAAADASSAMTQSMEMIRSGRRDSIRLGLENLIALTDPIKTSPSVAVSISKFVVVGHGDFDVREEFRTLTERDVFASAPEEDELSASHSDEVRLMVLNVLSNALETCHTAKCLAEPVETDAWFDDFLIPLLVEELKLANTSACIACFAASCLSSLLQCSHSTHKSVLRHGGQEALENSFVVGTSRNALLASETQRCLDMFLVDR